MPLPYWVPLSCHIISFCTPLLCLQGRYLIQYAVLMMHVDIS
nr:hypothetical protein Iba_chr13aCG6420 [Ipomoea batatas]GME09720.1 hypothetical protein Iba_scaffold9076CG0010 [Ipomoea batatas]